MTEQLKLKGKPVTEQPKPEQPKLDKAAATFVKIRDARTELKRQYEAADLELQAQLETLKSFFLETLRSLGEHVESVQTKYGTIYRSTEIKPSCQDWAAFYAWIAETEAFEALERRVKKSFIVDYMVDNSNELPPGITVLKEYTVTVRRS